MCTIALFQNATASYSYHLLRRPLTQGLLSVTVLEEILNSYVLVAY